MLGNKALLIAKKINILENQKENELKIQSYRRLMTRLKDAQIKLDNLIEIKYVLGKNIENINLDNIIKNLKDIKNTIINGKIIERECAILYSTLDSIEIQLKSEWKKHHQEKTKSIIETLTNIKPFFNNQIEVNEIMNNLSKFENVWPINRAKYDIFEENITLAKDKINELELTDDVRRFIRRITSNNATILDLTPNILNWIKENKFENKIKLKFN